MQESRKLLELDELSAASYGRKISLICDKYHDYNIICNKSQRKAEGLPDLQKKVED